MSAPIVVALVCATCGTLARPGRDTCHVCTSRLPGTKAAAPPTREWNKRLCSRCRKTTPQGGSDRCGRCPELDMRDARRLRLAQAEGKREQLRRYYLEKEARRSA